MTNILISLRVDQGLLADIKRESDKKGLPYQTYIKSVLRQNVANYCGVCGGKFDDSATYPTLKNKTEFHGQEICGDCQQEAEDEIY